jgi:Ca2+-dependent lipid-binding protein
VVKKNLNPVWNEEFVWLVKYSDIASTPLSLEVFDDDVLSADDSLGMAEQSLLGLFEEAVAGEWLVVAA